jgi:hypothetical protein
MRGSNAAQGLISAAALCAEDGLGFRGKGLGPRVQGFRFRILGLGFRVLGLGISAAALCAEDGKNSETSSDSELI